MEAILKELEGYYDSWTWARFSQWLKENSPLLAVSAGFDWCEENRGRMHKTDDYHTIGKLVKDASQNICQGRRFALLEGGYNHQVLGKNVKAFLKGLE